MNAYSTKLITSSQMQNTARALPETSGYNGSNHFDVNLIVPCYNEAERLDGEAFLTFLHENPQIRITFVNDGSKDNTLSLLNRIGEANQKQIEVLNLTENQGKAEAVRQGLLHASRSNYKLVGYWDADLATPLSAISDFIGIANRYHNIEVIFGSRVPFLGHRIERTFFRRLISRINSNLARLAIRLPIHDTQCGAKLFRNTPALRSSIKERFEADWLFDVELFSRLSSQVESPRTSFFEFPLAEWTEVAGSKVSTKVIFASGVKMLTLVYKNNFGKTRLAAVRRTNNTVTSAA